MLFAAVVYDLAGTASTGIRLMAAYVAARNQSARDVESDRLAAAGIVVLVCRAVWEASWFGSGILSHLGLI